MSIRMFWSYERVQSNHNVQYSSILSEIRQDKWLGNFRWWPEFITCLCVGLFLRDHIAEWHHVSGKNPQTAATNNLPTFLSATFAIFERSQVDITSMCIEFQGMNTLETTKRFYKFGKMLLCDAYTNLKGETFRFCSGAAVKLELQFSLCIWDIWREKKSQVKFSKRMANKWNVPAKITEKSGTFFLNLIFLRRWFLLFWVRGYFLANLKSGRFFPEKKFAKIPVEIFQKNDKQMKCPS